MLQNAGLNSSGRTSMAWDSLIRLAGIALFLLLVVAYATGDEYEETHQMIGYALATLVGICIFWLIVRPHELSAMDFGSRAVQALRNDSVAKNVAPVVLILMALPLCALLIMALTHTVKGTTWIDEMHEVVAYFAIGLVALYAAMVGIASSHYIGERFRNVGRSKHP